MVGAVPGVTVAPQLSNFPQFQEKVRIGLSARSVEIDLMACSGSKVREFAKAGWLEPLDDLWDKYRDEYDLDLRDPKVFLFDEPLSNLDAHLRAAMRKELIKLHRRLQATMVYVTHDQVEAMTMGDVIVVMRDGEIQQHGPPLEVFHRPANVFVASFIGAPPMNMVSGALAKDGGRTVVRAGASAIVLPPAMGHVLEHASGREVVFGVRPQDLALRPNEDAGPADLNGKIVLVEHLGTETLVDIEVPGFSLQASMPPTDTFAEGQRVGVSLDFTKSHVFDAAEEGVLCHGVDHR